MSKHKEVCDNSDYFNLNTVHNYFNECLVEDDDLHLGPYLDAYQELCKFCSLTGSVFEFVKSEIESKSQILVEFRKSDKNGNFMSLKSMIKHEMESNLLVKSNYVSGSRTLLRLHRGLDFIRHFLRRVSELDSGDHTNRVGKEVYNETLAKFHPWYVRTGAQIAMHFLPSRDTLFKQVCGNNIESSLQILPLMLEVTNEVYNRTENCFKSYDLLDLP